MIQEHLLPRVIDSTLRIDILRLGELVQRGESRDVLSSNNQLNEDHDARGTKTETNLDITKENFRFAITFLDRSCSKAIIKKIYYSTGVNNVPCEV